jgi:putative DNA primase/helicase
VVTITHFSKSTQATTTKALHRFIGSIAFVAAARAGFAVMEDPNDKGRRLFLEAKNNLAPPALGLAYRLEERVAVATADGGPIYATAIVWEDEHVTQTADEVLAGSNGGGLQKGNDNAKAFLRNVLGAGPVLATEALKAGEAELLTPKMVRTAREALGVIIKREGFGPSCKVWWELPATPDTDARYPS